MHRPIARARFLLATLAALSGLHAGAQAMPEWLDPDLALDTDGRKGLRVEGRFVHRSYDKRHDALMHRNDFNASQFDNWEKGYLQGNANGIRLEFGRDKGGALFAQYLVEESQFEWRAPGSYHRVESDGHELQLGWRQVAETWEGGLWGWEAGYLRSKSDKWMETQERGAFRPAEGNITWDMLRVGYFGEWQPILSWLYFFGDIGGRFGEVEGIARRGNDRDWKDGRIREGYIVDSSLAYGAHARIGAGVAYRGFMADVSYFRSWMYSFDATDSGTVVFPDNDDALFIQNDGGFEFRVGYRASF